MTTTMTFTNAANAAASNDHLTRKLKGYPPGFGDWPLIDRNAHFAAAAAAHDKRVVTRPANVTPPPVEATRPYPLDCLGDVLADAARAIAAKIQCPEAMAAQSVLSVASLASQALADVRLPYGQTRPLSLFALTIAASGDRKTSADNEAMAPVRMREKQLRDVYEPLARDHAIALAAWRAQKSAIERSKGTVHEKTIELGALGPEPAAPLRPILTISESTAEGLAKHMPSLRGALGIFSAEGAQFLHGHGFSDDAKLRTAGGFSQLWDGDAFRRLRAGDGVTDLHGRRLAVHLMVQPNIAADVLNDPVLRDQGLLARFLVAAPETMAGTRLWKEPTEMTAPALRKYAARILAIFEAPIQTLNAAGNELDPRALEMSDDARAAWINFHNAVEGAQKSGSSAAGLRDVAGKAAEQAARIAGVLTLVDDRHATEIDGDTMLRACELAKWYLKDALRLVTEADPAKHGAELLKAWVVKKGLRQVTATQFLTRGPRGGGLRKKENLDPAIAVLEDDGFLTPSGKDGRTWDIRVSH